MLEFLCIFIVFQPALKKNDEDCHRQLAPTILYSSGEADGGPSSQSPICDWHRG